VVSTSETKDACAMADICFDPVNLLTKQPLNKSHHRILYFSPKYVDNQTPESYRQWLMFR